MENNTEQNELDHFKRVARRMTWEHLLKLRFQDNGDQKMMDADLEKDDETITKIMKAMGIRFN